MEAESPQKSPSFANKHDEDLDFLDLLESDSSDLDEDIRHKANNTSISAKNLSKSRPHDSNRSIPLSSPEKQLTTGGETSDIVGLGLDEDARPVTVNVFAKIKTSGKYGDRIDKPSTSSSIIQQVLKKFEKDDDSLPSTSSNIRRYENNPQNAFVTGFNVMSKEACTKRNSRAKRFGIVKKEQDDVIEEHTSQEKEVVIRIPKKGSKIDGHLVRSEALFISGVDNMSTQDVFRYFGSYGPSSIEWLNDTSCNVVWLDSNTTARALIGMSQQQYINKGPMIEEITPRIDLKSHDSTPAAEPMEEGDDDYLDLISDSETGERVRVPRRPCQELVDRSNRENYRSDDADMEVEKVDDDKPFDITEEQAIYDALPFGKSDHLQIRYATKGDKKQVGAQNRSWYYVKNGNPNYNGMKGIISNSMKKRITDGKTSNTRPSRKRRMEAYVDEDKLMKREKTASPHGDGDDENLEQEVKLLTRAPSPKRVMRMYADDVEQQVKSIRKLSAAPVGLQVVIEPENHMTNRNAGELNTSGIIRRIGRHPLRSDAAKRTTEHQTLFPDLRGKLNRKTCKRQISENISFEIGDEIF
ncbi:uncharacterized protein [Antedon mediterranea]|uniref:uncharacterized protein n=1 Tax=Antedon mediterranea TaxID=105859 RepID=UPI003AF62743